MSHTYLNYREVNPRGEGGWDQSGKTAYPVKKKAPKSLMSIPVGMGGPYVQPWPEKHEQFNQGAFGNEGASMQYCAPPSAPPSLMEGSFQTGNKRRSSLNRSGKPSNTSPLKSSPQKKKIKTTISKASPTNSKDTTLVAENDAIPKELKQNIEKLRKRKVGEIKENPASEDVDKLAAFSFDGVNFTCITCGLNFKSKTALTSHLMDRSHSMNVISARADKKYDEVKKILDIDIRKDDWLDKSDLAKTLLKKQSKCSTLTKANTKISKDDPSNYHKYGLNVKKLAAKNDDDVIMTSVLEFSMSTKDFAGVMEHGNEFIRAVTGYYCTLCEFDVRDSNAIVPHMESILHKNNYLEYLEKNPEYEDEVNSKNAKLLKTLTKNVGKSVVVLESQNCYESQFLSSINTNLIRNRCLMDSRMKDGLDENYFDELDDSENDTTFDDSIGTVHDESNVSEIDADTSVEDVDKM